MISVPGGVLPGPTKAGIAPRMRQAILSGGLAFCGLYHAEPGKMACTGIQVGACAGSYVGEKGGGGSVRPRLFCPMSAAQSPKPCPLR